MSNAATLGVQTKPGPNNGLVAIKVDPAGSAGKAGVAVGDELVAINGKPTPTPEAISACLAAAGGVGATVTLTVIRGREKIELKAALKRKMLSLDVEDVSEVLERKISP